MKKVFLFIILAALFFGTMEVALKLASNTLDAFQITFLRFFIGGLVLLPFSVRENLRPCAAETYERASLTGKTWLCLILLGAINVPLGMVIFQLGVMRSNAATAAVIFSCNPVFTMLLAHFFTGDRMNRHKVLALSVGCGGLILMIRPWDLQPGNTLSGAFLSIAAAAVFSLYSVLGGKTIGRIGAFTQTSASFLTGSLILLAFLFIADKPVLSGITDNLAILIYTSIVVTGGGYLFYFFAIKYSSTTTASTVFFLKPVIAPVFAVLALHENITYNMYIGIALILAASYILNRKPLKKA
jgi:drug/metabolite transporter (DMT)-like permease